ncbi:Fc.00g050930.m01.CDS01 [Cosmosporella sp. VM-42]
MALAMLALGLPTGVSAKENYPYFAAMDTNQSVCDMNPDDGSFALMPLPLAKTSDCDALQSNLKRDSGQYIVGGFETNPNWQIIGQYESCALAFQATYTKDAKNNGRWYIGNNDAYKLVTDAVEMVWVNGEGAAEGTLPCPHGPDGGDKSLMWRVWDARE